MKIINLTPHALNIYGNEKLAITIPASGTIARCTEVKKELPSITVDGVEIAMATKSFGEVTGLPEKEEEGILYFVSALVAGACKNRHDLIFPDSLVRDAEGKIIGVESFSSTRAIAEVIADWTFADGTTTTVRASIGEFGQLSVIDLETGEDLQDTWEETDFPELMGKGK